MATYYVDFEGAAGTGDGSSFANRASSFANVVGGGNPDDIFRIKATAPVTSLGNATWTGAKKDIVSKAISSSTNASPIVITTSANHGFVQGDYVNITSHTGNTNALGVWLVGTVPTPTTFQILQMDGSNTTGSGVGTTGTIFKVTNCMVKLPSPVTKNIALCGGQNEKPIWTASTNVTTSRNTTLWKEGYSSATIAINATFTTGKAAYYTLPAALDLSSYQQVSFWLYQLSGTVPTVDGQISLALCSDTLGNTVVNTLSVPLYGNTGNWNCITVDLGANLGSSIASVALYVSTDLGAQTFYIDNIIACKSSSIDDSLTLNSLISKGAGLGEWFGLQSINYDVLMIGTGNNYLPSNPLLRGYYGATETVTTYKRQPLRRINAVATNIGGSSIGPVTYSAGWNRTDMSTQTDYTWLDGISARQFFYGIDASAVQRIFIERLCATRFGNGFFGGGTSVKLSDAMFTSCLVAINAASSLITTGNLYLNNNISPTTLSSTVSSSFGAIKSIANCVNTININTGHDFYFESIEGAYNMATTPVSITTGSNNWIGKLVAGDNNASFALTTTTGRNNVVGSGSSFGHSVAGFQIATGTLFVNNFTINESQDVSIGGTGNLGTAYFNRLDNTDKNSWIYNWPNFGTINQQTTVVDAPATSAWRFLAQGSANEARPLKLKLGTVVVAAGSLVTVTARMLRDTTDVTMQLVCPAGQIAGVTSDVKSTLTAAADTWETVTITFTPTNAGAVDIYAYTFDGSDPTYVCNLTVTQA